MQLHMLVGLNQWSSVLLPCPMRHDATVHETQLVFPWKPSCPRFGKKVPSALVELVEECWAPAMEDRPDFKDITNRFQIIWGASCAVSLVVMPHQRQCDELGALCSRLVGADAELDLVSLEVAC